MHAIGRGGRGQRSDSRATVTNWSTSVVLITASPKW